MAVGLTSQARHADGTARVAVIQPRWAGLRAGPSFLWGENLTRVNALDLGDHIGWASPISSARSRIWCGSTPRPGQPPLPTR